MDHFYQLPGLGAAEQRDARVLHHARRARPAHLDRPAVRAGHRQHVPQSGDPGQDRDRAGHGVARPGAAWASAPAGTSSEHQAFGLEFGTFTERFERLEEALQIIAPMLRGEQPTFTGSWYKVHGRHEQPAAAADDPDHAGRQRRAEDVPAGGEVRRRHRTSSAAAGHPAQGRRAARALRGDRPRPRHAADELPRDGRPHGVGRADARHARAGTPGPAGAGLPRDPRERWPRR